MLSDYIEIPVRIPVDKNGDIYQRLARLAEQEDSDIERELSFAVTLGINHHIRQNLDLVEHVIK